MRVMRVLVLSLLAACASTQPGSVSPRPASLEGTYRLDRVNGQPLPAPSGDEDGVMLEEGSLALQPDSSFTLRMVARVRSRPTTTTAEVSGDYRVRADSLSLIPDDCSPADDSHFRWSVHDAVLHLRDQDGDEFIFVRQ